MKGSIFISYRRKEATAVAFLLRDWLVRDGYRVFMDVVDIHTAEKWAEMIEQAVSNCAVLLALMGRDWLEVKDDDGRRRLDNPGDWVRFEIEAALQRDVPVIPVLIDNAETPKRSELPMSLRAAVDREATSVRVSRFEVDYTYLKNAIDEHIKSPRYARALSTIAGLLLVLAGAGFATLGRPPNRLVPIGPGFFGTQIADFVAAVGLVVLGAGLLFTRSWWKNAGWLATAGLFMGLIPFLSLRIWRSADVRPGEGLLGRWGPLALIFLALVLIAILLALNPEVAFARPRVSGDSTLTAIVLGVVALIGLAAIGVVLPTVGADLATHKFSDPWLLYFAVPLAIIAAYTQGFPRAAVLAGWTSGTAGVLVTTVWLRLHPGRNSGIILNAHLLLSIFTVAILATISVLALRKSLIGNPFAAASATRPA
jgi:hypothetical protein